MGVKVTALRARRDEVRRGAQRLAVEADELQERAGEAERQAGQAERAAEEARRQGAVSLALLLPRFPLSCAATWITLSPANMQLVFTTAPCS